MTSLILDGYVSDGLVRAAKATWPNPSWGHWLKYPSGKLVSKSPHGLPQAVRCILEQLAEFPLDRLQLDRAFPDLEYLHGAGMHQLSAGESLGRHLDTERHPILPWKREATAIIYLDTPESGGELVFTSDDGYVQKEIAPKENRLVLFKTSGQWHQVNKCESTRRSICLFFWSICDETFQGNQNAKFVDY